MRAINVAGRMQYAFDKWVWENNPDADKRLTNLLRAAFEYGYQRGWEDCENG